MYILYTRLDYLDGEYYPNMVWHTFAIESEVHSSQIWGSSECLWMVPGTLSPEDELPAAEEA